MWNSGKNCYSSSCTIDHLIKLVTMSSELQNYFKSYCPPCFYNFSLHITATLVTVNTSCEFVWHSTKNSRVTDLVLDVVLLHCFIFITMPWKTRSYYWNPSERDLITWKKWGFWSSYIKGNPFPLHNWFRTSHVNATFISVFWECQKPPSSPYSSMPLVYMFFIFLSKNV